jgi:hypothetical protein
MTRISRWWAALEKEPGLLGRVRRQWPWTVVVVCVVVGLVLIAMSRWRWGAGAVGSGMVVAGLFRTVMRNPGIIVIRPDKWVDLCFYYGLGLATIVFALIVPGL